MKLIRCRPPRRTFDVSDTPGPDFDHLETSPIAPDLDGPDVDTDTTDKLVADVPFAAEEPTLDSPPPAMPTAAEQLSELAQRAPRTRAPTREERLGARTPMEESEMPANHKPYVYKRAEDLGIPVDDAKLRVLVTVTSSDVVLAKKADSKHCALSRAALRLPGVNAAYFFRSMAFLEYDDRMIRFRLPESVSREIVSFDRAQIFAPGVYSLAPITSGMTRKAKTRNNRRARKPTERGGRSRVAPEVLAKIDAQEPAPENTPEQREFNNRIATALNRTAGGRTVSGAKSSKAPEPLALGGPGKRYVHRTQYVRDLREPA